MSPTSSTSPTSSLNGENEDIRVGACPTSMHSYSPFNNDEGDIDFVLHALGADTNFMLAAANVHPVGNAVTSSSSSPLQYSDTSDVEDDSRDTI